MSFTKLKVHCQTRTEQWLQAKFGHVVPEAHVQTHTENRHKNMLITLQQFPTMVEQ